MRISDWSSDVCSSDLFLGLRQRHPALDHLEGAPGLRRRVVEALRMGDAAAGGHPVHLAGANSLLGAEAVAVHEPAVEQIADGGEHDMRMRSDIGVATLIGRQLQRTGMIEETEEHPSE